MSLIYEPRSHLLPESPQITKNSLAVYSSLPGISLKIKKSVTSKRNSIDHQDPTDSYLPEIKSARLNKDYIDEFKGFLSRKASVNVNKKSATLGYIPSLSITSETLSTINESEQSQTLKPEKEYERRHTLVKHRKVDEAVNKVKRRIKLQKEDHSTKFNRRMTAFNGLTTYIDTRQFITHLNTNNHHPYHQNRSKSQASVIKEVKTLTSLSSGVDYLDDDSRGESTSARNQVQNPKCKDENDLKNPYVTNETNLAGYQLETTAKQAVEKLRKEQEKRVVNHPFYEEEGIDGFEANLEDKLINNGFENNHVEWNQQNDENTIRQLEMLKKMLHTRTSDEKDNIEAQKNCLQNFKRRSNKVITLLKRAAKKLYNQDEPKDRPLLPSSISGGSKNTLSSLDVLACKPASVTSLDPSTDRVNAGRKFGITGSSSLTSLDPSPRNDERRPLGDCTGTVNHTGNSSKKRTNKPIMIPTRDKSKRITSCIYKENTAPSLGISDTIRSLRSSVSTSQNNVTNNKKVNAFYNGYLDLIIAEASKEKKECNEFKTQVNKKLEKLSQLNSKNDLDETEFGPSSARVLRGREPGFRLRYTNRAIGIALAGYAT